MTLREISRTGDASLIACFIAGLMGHFIIGSILGVISIAANITFILRKR